MEGKDDNVGMMPANEFTDMIKAGVIDPTKVVRAACKTQHRLLVFVTTAMVAKARAKEPMPAPDMAWAAWAVWVAWASRLSPIDPVLEKNNRRVKADPPVIYFGRSVLLVAVCCIIF